MTKVKSKFHLPSILAAVWVIFSISLVTWWIIFGFQQIEKMKSLHEELADNLLRQERMLSWEGSFLILCLIMGGVALLYYIHREFLRNLQIKEFFATFTHELKTSLASLRLQAESLEEDLKDSGASDRLLSRLKNDTVRLELQLENSLFLAHSDASRMILETVDLQRVISSIQRYWPEFQIQLGANCRVRADERALESVLKNLIQNAIVHGQATAMKILVLQNSEGVELKLQDNGHGFKGDQKNLGTLFFRHTTKSGSGVGLYLSRELMKKMGGRLEFEYGQGFTTKLIFAGGEV